MCGVNREMGRRTQRLRVEGDARRPLLAYTHAAFDRQLSDRSTGPGNEMRHGRVGLCSGAALARFALALLCALAGASSTWAKQGALDAWVRQYGPISDSDNNAPGCGGLCHYDTSTTTPKLNAYGAAIRTEFKKFAAYPNLQDPERTWPFGRSSSILPTTTSRPRVILIRRGPLISRRFSGISAGMEPRAHQHDLQGTQHGSGGADC